MAEQKQKKQTQKQTKHNPGQAARTAANRERNIRRDKADKLTHAATTLPVPRGTARAKRREAWASVRTRIVKKIEVITYTKDGNPMKAWKDVAVWSPSFAEYSLKQAGIYV